MTLEVSDFDNAEVDLKAIEDIVNGSDTQIVTTRLGRNIDTLAKVIASLASQDVGSSAAALINQRIDGIIGNAPADADTLSELSAKLNALPNNLGDMIGELRGNISGDRDTLEKLNDALISDIADAQNNLSQTIATINARSLTNVDGIAALASSVTAIGTQGNANQGAINALDLRLSSVEQQTQNNTNAIGALSNAIDELAENNNGGGNTGGGASVSEATAAQVTAGTSGTTYVSPRRLKTVTDAKANTADLESLEATVGAIDNDVLVLEQQVADIETGASGEEFDTLADLQARAAVTAATSGRRVTLLHGNQSGEFVLQESLLGTPFQDKTADGETIIAITAGGFAIRDVFWDLAIKPIAPAAGNMVQTPVYATQANPTFMQFWTGQDARTNFMQNTHGEWEARTNGFGLIQDFPTLKANNFINEYGLPTAIPAGADYVLSPPMMAGWTRFNSWMRDLGTMIFECDVDVQPEIINHPGLLTPIADGPTGLKRWRFQLPTTHDDFVYVLWRSIPQEPTIASCYPENLDPSADGGWSPWFIGKGAQYARKGINRYGIIRTLDLDNFNPKDIISVDQVNTPADLFWGAPKRTPAGLAKCGVPFESLFKLSEATNSAIWHLAPIRLGATRIFDDNLPGSPLFYGGPPVAEFYTDYVQEQATNILASDEFEKWIEEFYNAFHNAPATVKTMRHILEIANELWNTAPNFYLLSYMAMAIAHAVNPAWQTNPTFEFNGSARQGLGYMTARAIKEWDRLQAQNGTDYELIWAISCQTAVPFSIDAAMEGFDFYCAQEGLSAATIADMKSRCQSFGTSYWEGALSNRDINGNPATPPVWGILGSYTSWEDIRNDYNSGALSETALLDGLRQFYDDASLTNYLNIPRVRALHNEFATRSANLGLGGKWGILPHGGTYEGTTHEDQNSLAPNITQAQLDLLAVWYGSAQFADVTRTMLLGLAADHGNEFILSNYPVNAMTDDGSQNGGNIGRFTFHSGGYPEETEQFLIWDNIFLQLTASGTPDSPGRNVSEREFFAPTLGITRTTTSENAYFEYLLNGQGQARVGYLSANQFSIQFSSDGETWEKPFAINEGTGTVIIGRTSLRQDGAISFSTTINGVERFMSIQPVGQTFVFNKPFSNDSLSDGARYRLLNVGCRTVGNPFWQGFQLASPTVTENGSNRQPIASGYWEYSSPDDPDDLRFVFRLGNSGSLTTSLVFESVNGGNIEFDPGAGNVRIGSAGGPAPAKLTVDGMIKLKNYAEADLPTAASVGPDILALVTIPGGETRLVYSKDDGWRNTHDNSFYKQ
jgi:hypothetical protein